MRVKATAEAYFNDSRIHEGDIITVPDGFKASWAEPVVIPTAKKKASKAPASKKKRKAKAKTGEE